MKNTRQNWKALALAGAVMLFTGCATMNPETGRKECQAGCRDARIALVVTAIVVTAGALAVAAESEPKTVVCTRGLFETTCNEY